MQSVIRICFALSILSIVPACQKKKLSNTPEMGVAAKSEAAIKEADSGVSSPNTKGLAVGPEKEAFMCEQGEVVIRQIEKTNFLDLFHLLCDNKGTTQRFKDLVASAYDGKNEAKVTLISSASDEMFNTRLIVGFAMKAPLGDPAQFFALKAHDVLLNGLRSNRSEMIAKVESRKTFPGRRSIEEIIINYSLSKSEGGALFDTRRTEFNTYLLDEARTDVTISLEEMLDVEKSKSYSGFRGIVLGLQAANNETYLVFLNDMFIKNRIDPLRLQRTLLALNGEMQRVMFPLFTKAK